MSRDLCPDLLLTKDYFTMFKVVHQRFPKHSLEAVGSAFFLRFINPAISKSIVNISPIKDFCMFNSQKLKEASTLTTNWR